MKRNGAPPGAGKQPSNRAQMLRDVEALQGAARVARLLSRITSRVEWVGTYAMAAITVDSAPAHGRALSAVHGIAVGAVASVPVWVAVVFLLRALRRSWGRAA